MNMFRPSIALLKIPIIPLIPLQPEKPTTRLAHSPNNPQ